MSKLTSMRESRLFKNKLRRPPPSTIRRSSKRDSEDSLEESPSSRSEDPLTSRSENSRIESKTLSAPLELLVTRESSQVEDLLFSTLPRNWTKSRESTSTKTTESRSLRRLAPSQLELFARTLASKDQLLLISCWSLVILREDSTPLREST